MCGLQYAEYYVESGCNDGHHAHELDEDVERRTGCVLEGVAYGIAYDGSLMGIRALAAEITFLDILLGIVPGTAGVGHEDGEYEA